MKITTDNQQFANVKNKQAVEKGKNYLNCHAELGSASNKNQQVRRPQNKFRVIGKEFFNKL